MRFESIKDLNLFIFEYDEVDFVGGEDESEFLDLVNEELKNYKRKNPFNVRNSVYFSINKDK